MESVRPRKTNTTGSHFSVEPKEQHTHTHTHTTAADSDPQPRLPGARWEGRAEGHGLQQPPVVGYLRTEPGGSWKCPWDTL